MYGLVHPLDFWDPVKGQLYHYSHILSTVRSYSSASHRVSAVIKGPGWSPGSPWTGHPEDIPRVQLPVQKYDSGAPLWTSAYVVLHFGFLQVLYGALVSHMGMLSPVVAVGGVGFIILTLQSFGAIFDHKSFCCATECLRCVFVVAVLSACDVTTPAGLEQSAVDVMYVVFVLSSVLWATLTLVQYDFSSKGANNKKSN